MASVWQKRNKRILVWSRGGRQLSDRDGMRISTGLWVAEWKDVFSARNVIIAIPGGPLVGLARDCEEAQAFEGAIYSAAIALSYDTLLQLFPKATIVRIAPFLIDGQNSVPMLALRPVSVRGSDWLDLTKELSAFGELDVVEDEIVFDQLTLTGSPWPAVINSLVKFAAESSVKGLESDSTAIGLKLFYRAMHSIMLAPSETLSERQFSKTIATPGGVTERGLRGIEEGHPLIEHVFSEMKALVDQVRTEATGGSKSV